VTAKLCRCSAQRDHYSAASPRRSASAEGPVSNRFAYYHETARLYYEELRCARGAANSAAAHTPHTVPPRHGSPIVLIKRPRRFQPRTAPGRRAVGPTCARSRGRSFKK
jgi:hypothetical protein